LKMIAVLRIGFTSSLNHKRTCWGAVVKMALIVGSVRKRMAYAVCALALVGENSIKQRENGAAMETLRRIADKNRQDII